MYHSAQCLFLVVANPIGIDIEHNAHHIGSFHHRSIGIFRQQTSVGEEEIAHLQQVFYFTFALLAVDIIGVHGSGFYVRCEAPFIHHRLFAVAARKCLPCG